MIYMRLLHRQHITLPIPQLYSTTNTIPPTNAIQKHMGDEIYRPMPKRNEKKRAIKYFARTQKPATKIICHAL